MFLLAEPDLILLSKTSIMASPTIPPEEAKHLRPEIGLDSASVLEEVIDLLRKSGASIASETVVLVMLKNLLARLAKENGVEADLSTLTAEQEKKLQEALEQIAEQLKQAGLMGNEVNLQRLVRMLLRSHQPSKAKEKDEDGKDVEEDSFESLSPKEKARLKKLFTLFAVYEAYKITNPNQLAGETRQDNFINNLHMYGKEFAIKKTGSDMGLESKAIESMEKNHKSFAAQVMEFNKGKDTGWSR